MLGDSHSGSRDDESRNSRNIECPGSIAASPTGIHQGFLPGATGVEQFTIVDRNRSGSCADSFGESDDLFHRFALHVKTNQQCRSLRITAFAEKDLFHYPTGFFARERLAMRNDPM